MKCKNCNKEIDENSKVSPCCGEKIIPSEEDLEDIQEESKGEALEEVEEDLDLEDDLSEEEDLEDYDDYYDDEEEIYKDINDLLEELGDRKSVV